MCRTIFKFILTLMISLGIQTTFGQQNAEKTSLTQNYCFRILKPGEGGCPVGEDIPYDTPLLEAIRQRNIPEVKRLISEGANVNEADNKGLLPLILAGKQSEIIQLLINAGAVE